MLNEDLLNNDKLKKLTEEIDSFDEILTRISTEMAKIDGEMRHINELQKEALEKEFQTLKEQESKQELQQI